MKKEKQTQAGRCSWWLVTHCCPAVTFQDGLDPPRPLGSKGNVPMQCPGDGSSKGLPQSEEAPEEMAWLGCGECGDHWDHCWVLISSCQDLREPGSCRQGMDGDSAGMVVDTQTVPAWLCWGCSATVSCSHVPFYLKMTKPLIRIFSLNLALEKKN